MRHYFPFLFTVIEPSVIGSVNKISGVFIFRLFLSPTSSLSVSLIRRGASDRRHLTAPNRLSGWSSSHIPVSPKSYALCLCRRRVSDRRHLSPLRSFITATNRQPFLVGKLDLVGSMAPTKINVIHGGEWSDDNKYEGGRRELIPIPPGGISLKDLVAKIEMRLIKPRDGYVYEIDALINDDESIEGDSTDELTMRSLNKDPVADNSRLDKYPMASKTIPSFVNDHFNDDDDPNFHLDDFHHEDFQDEYLDDDDVGTQEEDLCGSNRHNVSLLQTTQGSVQ
ncbi:hypothetical protein OROMI_010862 [Orobanche minor]